MNLQQPQKQQRRDLRHHQRQQRMLVSVDGVEYDEADDIRILDDSKYPLQRYFPWKDLNEFHKNEAAVLGYTDETWDNLGTAEIELETYSNLNRRQKRAASALFGVDDDDLSTKDIWDCYINHYSSYKWSELEDAQVYYYFRILGYSESNWIHDDNDNDNSKHMLSWEGSPWYSLDAVQQNAAKQLCYQEETWNNHNLNEWHCTQDHYQDLTWDELDVLGIQPYFETLGFTATSWNNNNEKGEPSLSQIYWNSLSQEQKTALLHICYNKESWNGPASSSSYPVFRYRPWDSLADDVKSDAVLKLGYDETTWNTPGSAKIEMKSFVDLTKDQQSIAVQTFDMAEDSWNCWQNHYSSSQSWDSLTTIHLRFYNVQSMYTKLGWDEYSWKNFKKTKPGVIPTTPNADRKWNQLSHEEQESARRLCFVEQSWNLISLNQWHCNDMNCYCHYQLYNWDELAAESVQHYFETLGWTRYSWESKNDGDSKKSTTSWFQWPESYDVHWNKLTDNERNAATKICYNKNSWDTSIKNGQVHVVGIVF